MLMKVRHSAFSATPLRYLLTQLGTRKLVLTGQVTEQCTSTWWSPRIASRISTPTRAGQRCG